MTETVETDDTLAVRGRSRLMVLRLGLAVVAGALAGLAWWGQATALSALLTVCTAVQLGSAVLATGRVDVGPDGVAYRLPLWSRTIPWPDYWGFVTVTDISGIRVRLRRAHRRSVALPVPRSPHLWPDPDFERTVTAMRDTAARYETETNAVHSRGWGPRWAYAAVLAVLLAGALGYDRAWGWYLPGGDATAIPDPCIAATPAAQPVVGGIPGQSTTAKLRDLRAAECLWRLPGDRVLSVAYAIADRSGLHSGRDRARLTYNGEIPAADQTDQQAARCGDRSAFGYRGAAQQHVQAAAVGAALRGNVVVLGYLGPDVEHLDLEKASVTADDLKALHAVICAAVGAVELH